MTAPPEGSLVFRPSGLSVENSNSRTEVLEPKSSGQNRPMFHGPSWSNRSCVPLCSLKFRGTTGAASHERQLPLPAPLPDWPRKEPESSLHCLPAEIGPLVTCRALVPLPALGEAGTAVPITQAPCTPAPSRGSEKYGKKPVDNGDIGNNNWNHFQAPRRLPICSPCPTSTKCLNRLP